MSVAAHFDGVTKFLVRPIPIDFFFATTSHKLQGETLKRAVIMLIDKKERAYKNYRIQAQTGSKVYDAHKVYVACSRVRENDHMRVIGEGYERTIEHISNNVRFKPAIHAFMQAAVQRSSRNNFVVTLSEKIARLVYGGLLDAQKQREKKRNVHEYSRKENAPVHCCTLRSASHHCTCFQVTSILTIFTFVLQYDLHIDVFFDILCKI